MGFGSMIETKIRGEDFVRDAANEGGICRVVWTALPNASVGDAVLWSVTAMESRSQWSHVPKGIVRLF